MHPEKTPTLRQHERQFTWQILIPILLVVIIGLVVGGLTIWATFSKQVDSRMWADISLIWLLVPMLFMALFLAIVLAAVVYGLARLTKATPRLTTRAQELVESGAAGVRRIADGTTQPIVWVEQAVTVVRSAIRFLLWKK